MSVDVSPDLRTESGTALWVSGAGPTVVLVHGVLTEGVVLDAASIGVHESVPAERAAVRRSLAKLTGANPGNTTAAWRSWWEEHGDEWMADNPPGPPSTPQSREY